MKTGAEITIQFLKENQFPFVAGIPGGTNLPLYAALSKSNIRHILARHEQGAAFIAAGYARATGKPGVVFATSGPGVTNLITAIADCYRDFVPLIAITGQVPKALIGTDAFQEIATIELTKKITKQNFFVNSAEELYTILPQALYVATEGRPGPVLIDIPKDIQLQKIETKEFKLFKNINHRLQHTNTKDDFINSKNIMILEKICDAIEKAQKPVIIAGGGLQNDPASHALLGVAEKNNIPVAATLQGLGTFPSNHSLSLGMIGMHGHEYTNHLMEEADLVIALGMRFDDRATGNVHKFLKNARIIHADIEASEIHKIKKADLSYHGDALDVLHYLNDHLMKNDRSEWRMQIESYRKKYPVSKEEHSLFFKKLAESIPEDSIIVTDVGQHQMWTAQSFPFLKPKSFLTSGGLGTMGFGLPAAMGAALAFPERSIYLITGDGSIMMNLQELITLSEWNLNIHIILFDNRQLGLVRQQQKYFFEENYFASSFEKHIDFEKLASSFHIAYKKFYEFRELDEIVKMQGPCLVHIPIHEEARVLPMVPPGSSNQEMLLPEEKPRFLKN